jgi:hypothetical protein
MRVRLAYLAVLLTGLTLVGVALAGMRGVDATLRVAATSPQPGLRHGPPCHHGHAPVGRDGV